MNVRTLRTLVGLCAVAPATACAPHEAELHAARSASAFAASALVVASREELRAIRNEALAASAYCHDDAARSLAACQRAAVDRTFARHAEALDRLDAMVEAQHLADDALAAFDQCHARRRAADCSPEIERITETLPRVARAIQELRRERGGK